MECVGFKPPEDLVPTISIVKPTVAKLLSDVGSLRRALLPSSPRGKGDNQPLNYCMQSRRPRCVLLLPVTRSIAPFVQERVI